MSCPAANPWATLLAIYESRVTNHNSSCILSRMHDLGYFREHLGEFEQMARNRGGAIDFDSFRAIDQERRERITSAGPGLKASATRPARKFRAEKKPEKTSPRYCRK